MHRFTCGAALASAFWAITAPVAAEPITLEQAVAHAVANSPRIAISRARIEAAEGRARQAGVSPNPEVSLEVENFAGTGPLRNFQSTETTLAVSQRLEVGGQRAARRAVAAAERDVAVIQLEREQAELARDTELAFADLATASLRVQAAQEIARRAAQLAQTARVLVEAGRDPPLRQLRAEAELAEASAAEIEAFGQLVIARQQLATLIGSDDPELVAVGDAPAVTEISTDTDFRSINERVAVAERVAAAARVDLARTVATPDVTVSGGVRRFNDGRDTAFLAGVSVPIPIRDRNRGGIAEAQAEALATELQQALVRNAARRDQYQARTLFQAAELRLRTLEGPSLAQAEEAARLAQIGYAAGRFTFVELLDAQSALTSARRAIIDARLDRARALAALRRAQVQ